MLSKKPNWSISQQFCKRSAYKNCQSHLEAFILEIGRLWKKSGPFQGWLPHYGWRRSRGWFQLSSWLYSLFGAQGAALLLVYVLWASRCYLLLVVRRPLKRPYGPFIEKSKSLSKSAYPDHLTSKKVSFPSKSPNTAFSSSLLTFLGSWASLESKVWLFGIKLVKRLLESSGR